MKTSHSIDLTVVIATHNRRELLRRCLESLAAQTQDPASFEVIVADDGSDDGSAEMAEALSPPFKLRVLALPKTAHAAAQNSAIEVAEAETCLLLDDDVIASPELVAAHVDAHREIPAAIGIGAITQRPPSARDWYAHVHARSWNAHYEEFAFREAHWTDCYGANLSMPRWALAEVGGVSTEVPKGKDLDLAFRLTQAGCLPTYVPRAHVIHDDQKRRPRMLEDAAREGVMHLELSYRHPERAEALLDWSSRAGSKELLLRRLLIGLRVPPASLALAGPLVPGAERELLWYSIVRRLAFWRGVRQSVSRQTWMLLTHSQAIEAIAERLP